MLALAAAVIALQSGLTAAEERQLQQLQPSAEAVGEVLYVIGVCEPFLDEADAGHYLRTFVAPAPGQQTAVQQALNRMFSRMYVNGRTDPLRNRVTPEQCAVLIEETVADAEAVMRRDGNAIREAMASLP